MEQGMIKQTGKQFEWMVMDTFEAIKKLSATKGEEYTGRKRGENTHENFDRNAVRLNLTPEKVLAVYLGKHMDSIDTWINDLEINRSQSAPYSEPITGRIDDAILFLLLLKGMAWRRAGGLESAPLPPPIDRRNLQNSAARQFGTPQRRSTDKRQEKQSLTAAGQSLEARAQSVLGGVGLDLRHPPGFEKATGKEEKAPSSIRPGTPGSDLTPDDGSPW
jgi:hypothetical protein